jgi:hypothetical protein
VRAPAVAQRRRRQPAVSQAASARLVGVCGRQHPNCFTQPKLAQKRRCTRAAPHAEPLAACHAQPRSQRCQAGARRRKQKRRAAGERDSPGRPAQTGSSASAPGPGAARWPITGAPSARGSAKLVQRSLTSAKTGRHQRKRDAPAHIRRSAWVCTGV